MYPQSHIDLTNGLAQSRLSILRTEFDWAMSVGEVEVGDEIFRVQGVSRPIALRKVGSHYRLIASVDVPTIKWSTMEDSLGHNARQVTAGQTDDQRWMEIEII
jgi:hypothetical protein